MNKKYIKFLPLVIAVIAISVYLVYANYNYARFSREKVNSKVVGRSNWQLRTTEFYLENGLQVDSTGILPYNIKVGDSISKEANSLKFKVYRKNKFQRFEFYKAY
ncbi:hypothetical protein [Chryseobacterium sp. 2R14A]|uniref:hypothetical protein n=1 Tax=Chryseobacterium sp. 2R14A TaxID=3380353 RepID=UPI003CFAC45D